MYNAKSDVIKKRKCDRKKKCKKASPYRKKIIVSILIISKSLNKSWTSYITLVNYIENTNSKYE